MHQTIPPSGVSLHLTRSVCVYQYQTLTHPISLPQYLASDKGKKAYGNYKYAEDVKKNWTFAGVQQTDTQNLKVYGARQDAAITVFKAHRVLTPDLWLWNKTIAKQGDHLYLLWMRFREQPLFQDDAFDAPEESKNDEHPVQHELEDDWDEMEEARESHGLNKDDVQQPGDDDYNKCYWQLVGDSLERCVCVLHTHSPHDSGSLCFSNSSSSKPGPLHKHGHGKE